MAEILYFVHLLITAGPTREYLDDVRCLTNPSSGRMGFAMARAARKGGHRVTLVTGPSEEADPKGVTVVRIESAREMMAAVERAFPGCDAMVATAAVSDFRPAVRLKGKVKKGRAALTVRLVANPDVLAWCGARKGDRVLVGFALESGDGRANAHEKRVKKDLDLVVLNGPASFGSEMIAPVLVTCCGEEKLPAQSKDRLAARLLRFLEERV